MNENELSQIIEDMIEMIDYHLEAYPEWLFPKPVNGCCVDRYSAAGCRLMGKLVKYSILKYYGEYDIIE